MNATAILVFFNIRIWWLKKPGFRVVANSQKKRVRENPAWKHYIIGQGWAVSGRPAGHMWPPQRFQWPAEAFMSNGQNPICWNFCEVTYVSLISSLIKCVCTRTIVVKYFLCTITLSVLFIIRSN